MQLLNNNYSYDSFIYEIFSSRFYILIISKFDEKYNYFHRLKLNDSKQIHFFHLISFLYDCVIEIMVHLKIDCIEKLSENDFFIFKNSKKVDKSLDFKCEYCSIGNEDTYLYEELVQKTATFFVLSKKYLSIMFNVLFEIDLTHVQSILNRVKNPKDWV